MQVPSGARRQTKDNSELTQAAFPQFGAVCRERHVRHTRPCPQPQSIRGGLEPKSLQQKRSPAHSWLGLRLGQPPPTWGYGAAVTHTAVRRLMGLGISAAVCWEDAALRLLRVSSRRHRQAALGPPQHVEPELSGSVPAG